MSDEMNYYIGDKHVGRDFPCIMCGKPMKPTEMEYTHDPRTYMERGEVFYYDHGLCTTTIKHYCECGVEQEITIQDRAVANQPVLTITTDGETCVSQEYVIMAVTSVKYGRVKNLGNYETERLEAEVVLDPGQTPEEGIIEAKRFVKRQLDLGPSDEDLEAARDLLREMGEL
jgi:hypothetical protein